jgi:hypothetical protein
VLALSREGSVRLHASKCKIPQILVRFTFATRMTTATINIRHIFDSSAGGAAIFAVLSRRAATIWMSALLGCVIRHGNGLLGPNLLSDHKLSVPERTCWFDAQSAAAVASVLRCGNRGSETLGAT